MLEYKLRDWREVIDLDFPPVEVTEETRQRCKEYRLAVRKPYKTEKYEAWREKILSTPLP